MSTVKVLVPKEAAEFIKSISDMDDCTGRIRYNLFETFYENEDGALYMESELIEWPTDTTQESDNQQLK